MSSDVWLAHLANREKTRQQTNKRRWQTCYVCCFCCVETNKVSFDDAYWGQLNKERKIYHLWRKRPTQTANNRRCVFARDKGQKEDDDDGDNGFSEACSHTVWQLYLSVAAITDTAAAASSLHRSPHVSPFVNERIYLFFWFQKKVRVEQNNNKNSHSQHTRRMIYCTSARVR